MGVLASPPFPNPNNTIPNTNTIPNPNRIDPNSISHFLLFHDLSTTIILGIPNIILDIPNIHSHAIIHAIPNQKNQEYSIGPIFRNKMSGLSDRVQTFGRKKTAVAVALVKPGTGQFRINGMPIDALTPEVLRVKGKKK